MQESLIGYLLGALDADEAARLEARLEQDPQLQERLRHAAQTLRPHWLLRKLLIFRPVTMDGSPYCGN